MLLLHLQRRCHQPPFFTSCWAYITTRCSINLHMRYRSVSERCLNEFLHRQSDVICHQMTSRWRWDVKPHPYLFINVRHMVYRSSFRYYRPPRFRRGLSPWGTRHVKISFRLCPLQSPIKLLTYRYYHLSTI
jgi:hypothetical protein